MDLWQTYLRISTSPWWLGAVLVDIFTKLQWKYREFQTRQEQYEDSHLKHSIPNSAVIIVANGHESQSLGTEHWDPLTHSGPKTSFLQ